MKSVFVSYKREDETQVIRLISALEKAGFSVWWDRSLSSGENWRTQIQTALSEAGCVIAAWSHESIGPSGDFVRDEASDGKKRGVLVPVVLDSVEPPLGFREIQTIDLTRWNGDSRDPYFQDLVDAVSAKLEGRAVPPSKGPKARLVRRLRYGSLFSAALFLVVTLGLNIFHLQDRICSASIGQPALSDLCGTLRLGDRPTREERIAWERRAPGSCTALRNHIERFPQGAFRSEAVSLLEARQLSQTEVWTPVTRTLRLHVPASDTVSANQSAAREAALTRAAMPAQLLCKGFDATTLYRVRSSEAVAESWACTQTAKGVTCGFEGEARCQLEQRSVSEQESCGK